MAQCKYTKLLTLAVKCTSSNVENEGMNTTGKNTCKAAEEECTCKMNCLLSKRYMKTLSMKPLNRYTELM